MIVLEKAKAAEKDVETPYRRVRESSTP